MSLRHPAVAGSFLLLFLVQAGCVHQPHLPPETGADRSGPVGVVSAKFLPDVVLDLPAKGRIDGAVRGAGRGFRDWALAPLAAGAQGMSGCSGEACGYLAIGILAVAAASGTIGAVVGGVQGALRAIPAGEAREIEEASRHLADLGIQETMRDHVLYTAEDAGGCEVVVFPAAGPPASDCVVDYGGLAAGGVGSVAEVAVLSVGFQGEAWGSRPPLSAFLAVRVRGYRTSDGQMLSEKELRYRSGLRYFPEWMAEEAVLLEEAIREGYRELAEEIAADMGCGPAPDPPGE